ncbi:MAG: TIGR03621 family F420-dependent LLM class oxidoreductase [Chloroflexota bacterium]|nr:TIGR03621 family F420-dependent LLM class oxidoreductase [Chloroflexota bacterium]
MLGTERARRVEELGYSTLVIPDRPGFVLSPLVALATAASATRRLRVGTYVLANGLRNPTVLAHECVTLDFLSEGRFELGIGTGVSEDDFRRSGLPYLQPGQRIDRLSEALQVVKSLTSGQETGFQGDYYQVEVPELWPRPVQQPRPPILIAARGKRALSLAGREADIVALGVHGSEGARGLFEKVELVREAAGDRSGQVELNLNLLAVVGEGEVPPQVRGRVRAFHGVHLEDLVGERSPLIVAGDADDMCDQLIELRARYGVSYVMVADDMMEDFAPVVARLAGH